MSKFRIKARLYFDASNHRNLVSNQIKDFIFKNDAFDEISYFSGFDESLGAEFLHFDFRFNARSNFDNVWNRIVNNMRDDLAIKDWILPGSRVSKHLCTHDNPRSEIQRCDESLEEFIK